jgi:peptidoglycan-associated lipoprotein
MNTTNFRRSGFALLNSLVLCACSETTPPAVTTADAHVSTPLRRHAQPPDVRRNDDTIGSIHVDDEIARLCNLPVAQFAFDSAAVEGEAARALDALAECFTVGALEGRALSIVGHADPRGPLDYNFGLGQRRAGSVAAYLGSRGLSDARMTTSSLGELEASGHDEGGWARDRKVEISLADEARDDSPYEHPDVDRG